VFFDELPGKLRTRWGDCQQGGSAIKNVLMDCLQSFQLRVAIRSPGASVKVED
jgi:hypothetical protein